MDVIESRPDKLSNASLVKILTLSPNDLIWLNHAKLVIEFEPPYSSIKTGPSILVQLG